jgi:CheY-like chemotaxis protein
MVESGAGKGTDPMNSAAAQKLVHGLVLVVEDDDDVREAMVETLRVEGYHVAEAGDGAEALRWLRGNSDPCLVLLDLWMPHMTGDELHAHMKQDPRLAALPIVVISAASDGAFRARQIGARDYLKKPLNLDDLISVVERNC